MKQETEDWFQNIFKGWEMSGWVTSVIKDIADFILIFFLISGVFSVLRRMITKSTSKSPSSQIVVAATTQEQEWWEGDAPKGTKV